MKTKFRWTSEVGKAFEKLKEQMATQPILRLPSFDKLFTLECDASGMAVGGVLSQEVRPATFFSEKLNEAKKKYSSYDLELYALVQSLRKWRHYLLPKEFVVFTDNQSLSYINTQEKLSNGHFKWMEYLQAFTFTIKHKKGQFNKVVDTLSKRMLTIQEVQLHSIGIESSRTSTRMMKTLLKLIRYVLIFRIISIVLLLIIPCL